MKKIGVFLFTALLCGSVSTIKAESNTKHTTFGFYGGLTFLQTTDDEGDELWNYGSVAGVELLKIQNKHLGFGIDAMFTQTGIKTTLDETKYYTGALMAVMRFSLFSDYNLKPYFLAGAGVNIFYTDMPNSTRESILKEISAGPAYFVGAGFEIDISPRLVIGAEGRWYNLYADKDKFGKDDYKIYALAAKLGLKFGRK